MALQKSKQDILFLQGLNQKVTSELLEAGAMTKLENLIMDKTGKLKKRPGWTALTTDAYESGALQVTSARTLHSYKGSLYLTGSYNTDPAVGGARTPAAPGVGYSPRRRAAQSSPQG